MRCCVLQLHTQCLQNPAESGELVPSAYPAVSGIQREADLICIFYNISLTLCRILEALRVKWQNSTPPFVQYLQRKFKIINYVGGNRMILLIYWNRPLLLILLLLLSYVYLTFLEVHFFFIFNLYFIRNKYIYIYLLFLLLIHI